MAAIADNTVVDVDNQLILLLALKPEDFLSILHLSLQELLVAKSHSSFPKINPSPQIGSHFEGIPSHFHPDSTKHVLEHPSFSSLFKSSQISFPLSNPSPQKGRHFEGSPIQI